MVITKCYFADCLLMTVFTKNPRFFFHVSVFIPERPSEAILNAEKF